MKIIIANLKSHKNQTQAAEWLQIFKQKFLSNELRVMNYEAVIAPSFNLVSLVNEQIKDLQNVSLSVQDLSPFPAGKYTGAVSTQNLDGFNVRYAILGHSERRRYFHETHIDVANKVERCVEANITPIVCVDDEYIHTQAAAIKTELLSKCLVAYEELSAIGTGKNEPVEHVQKVYQQIKQYFGQVKLIYGGSVNPENVAQYLAISDGVLVGTASLEAGDFVRLFK